LEGGDLLVLRLVGERLRRGERDLERLDPRSRLLERPLRSRLDDAFGSGERRDDRLTRSGDDPPTPEAFLMTGELERDLEPPRPRLELLLPRPLFARPDFSPDFSFFDFSSALLSSLARYSST